jgi:transposase
MSKAAACDDARSATCPAVADSCYCDRCDLLLGLEGVYVIAVEVAGDGGLRVVVETPAVPMGCRQCGVVARARGRRDVALVDVPSAGRAVELVWRKRTWRCLEPMCPTGSFTESNDDIARPRALLSTRAAWWAIGQLRREHACIQGLARQLGTTWKTVWRAVEPLLTAMAADPARFEGVTALGVDEHVWHHVSTKPAEDGGHGPKELTGLIM